MPAFACIIGSGSKWRYANLDFPSREVAERSVEQVLGNGDLSTNPPRLSFEEYYEEKVALEDEATELRLMQRRQ